MKLTKTINVQGTIVPAGTELHFSNEGVGYYNGMEIQRDMIPEVALEAEPAPVIDGFELHGLYVYDDELMQMYGLKTKAQPWIHTAIVRKPGHEHEQIVLYIWDTRTVLEAKDLKGPHKEMNHRSFKFALDNRAQLRMDGDNKLVEASVVALVNNLLRASKGKTIGYAQGPKDGKLRLGGKPAQLDHKKPVFMIVKMRTVNDKQRIVSVHATNNAQLLYKIKDVPETDPDGGFTKIFATSINELERGKALGRFDAVFNGDQDGFDEMLQDIIKNAKPAKQEEFWLCRASNEWVDYWQVEYGPKIVTKWCKGYTPKFVQ